MNKNISLIGVIAIAIIISGCVQQTNPIEQGGIRAGLDFQIDITENGKSDTVTLDFGNYLFKDNKTTFQTRDVVKEKGYIDLLFMKLDKQIPYINYSDIMISGENEFKVNYYQVFRINVGQSVALDGTDIKIKLIDILGSGCPEGSQC